MEKNEYNKINPINCITFKLTQPENLAWMAASKFILNVATQFKLGLCATKQIAGQLKISSPWCLAPKFKLVSDSLGGREPKFKSDDHIQYKIGCSVGTPFGMYWQFCEGEITEDNIPDIYELLKLLQVV